MSDFCPHGGLFDPGVAEGLADERFCVELHQAGHLCRGEGVQIDAGGHLFGFSLVLYAWDGGVNVFVHQAEDRCRLGKGLYRAFQQKIKPGCAFYVLAQQVVVRRHRPVDSAGERPGGVGADADDPMLCFLARRMFWPLSNRAAPGGGGSWAVQFSKL